MVRRGLLLLGLVLALTCGPTAIPATPSVSPSASSAPIASSDLITLRESDGRQTSIVVRKVATGELVRTLPDGLLLADGVTLVTVEGGGASTMIKKIDRRTGATIATHTIDGTWQLNRGYPSFNGASPDGSHLILAGGTYNFTDASGAWTAHTGFGLLDLTSWRIDPIDLAGRYSFQALSNDGKAVFLIESVPPQLPTSAQLRVYDLATRSLGGVTGDAMPPDVGFMPPTYAGGFAFQLFSSTESVEVRPGVITVTGIAKLARIDLTTRKLATVRLPLDRVPTGEDSLAWSLVPSRDGRTLYLVNPQANAIQELDVASLQIRRSGSLSTVRSQRTLLETALTLLHPTAEGKMGFGTGAALSPDGASIYVLGATGIWSIDLASLTAKALTRDGAYETVKISPDGNRLYVLSREDGHIAAVDAKSGQVLGTMKRGDMPYDILAVDAG